MALVRQLTTAGCRLISKYEYIVPGSLTVKLYVNMYGFVFVQSVFKPIDHTNITVYELERQEINTSYNYLLDQRFLSGFCRTLGFHRQILRVP